MPMLYIRSVHSADIGVMSGAVLFVEEDMKIKTFQKELLVGSLNLVSLLGGAFAGRLSDQIGRKGEFLVCLVNVVCQRGPT
jgi:MFS family permease